MTDGAVSNPDLVINLIAENAEHTRVHTFGMGSGVSTYLIEEAANAGRGTASFVSDNEDISDKVILALEQAKEPYLEGFQIEWEFTLSNGETFDHTDSSFL